MSYDFPDVERRMNSAIARFLAKEFKLFEDSLYEVSISAKLMS